ncbi:O-acetylhomoserine sulfhydrylase [Labilithrix luteola]|uniref:O-acetylhomoserine sulfhydrylase n=1 Tax=Labilithrix luteola TaxID=1391654 RepID=A0A0K1Q138_9BACT|nr:PLP-dependent aspartate aminotransferase family protein [Labilithrix luteola]AKU99447.1 O-acetylhomoserine sulfhydrylase [Labilithrix luteola]
MIDPALPYAEQLRRRADRMATTCVHAGETPDEDGALDVPIVLSSAFAFTSADQAARAFRGEEDAWIYGRWGNPTVRALEEKLAALEGAEAACATASGMAAIAGVVLSTCEAGDHVVAPRSMYAESARLLRERLPKLGITTTFVDGTAAAYAAAMTDKTRILYVETPSNPTLGVVDIAAIVKLAQSAKAPRPLVVVDGTFATPFAQSPVDLGADLVVHSMTKGISGHGDVIGGAVAGPRELVDRARELVVKGFGGVLSPLAAWLVLRGLRTFALRQERSCATAEAIARHLASHPKIAVVHHPSLPSHPGHALAQRQMHAYGALLSFELAGDDALARGRKTLEALRVATHAVSLGDTRTLVVHPASTTHSTMPEETRRLAGIGDGLLRMSCGLESADDLIADLDRALEAAGT